MSQLPKDKKSSDREDQYKKICNSILDGSTPESLIDMWKQKIEIELKKGDKRDEQLVNDLLTTISRFVKKLPSQNFSHLKSTTIQYINNIYDQLKGSIKESYPDF